MSGKRDQRSERDRYTDYVIGVVGMRGSGKSTWVRQHLVKMEPFVLIDPVFDARYEDLGLYRVNDFAALYQALESGYRRIVVTPEEHQIEYIIRICMAFGRDSDSGLTIVFDEADLYFPLLQLKDWKHKLINYGRHSHISCVFVARRPKMLNSNLRAQIQKWVVFPLNLEDHKFMCDLTQKELAQIEKPFYYEISDLKCLKKTIQYKA